MIKDEKKQEKQWETVQRKIITENRHSEDGRKGDGSTTGQQHGDTTCRDTQQRNITVL